VQDTDRRADSCNRQRQTVLADRSYIADEQGHAAKVGLTTAGPSLSRPFFPPVVRLADRPLGIYGRALMSTPSNSPIPARPDLGPQRHPWES